MKMSKENYMKYGEIVAKCWEDEDFKKKFITDPETVFKEFGMDVPEGIEYHVIECPKNIQYIILPTAQVKDSVQELAKHLLQLAEKSDVLIPAGMETRIRQNSEGVSYVILPDSPKNLSEAELARISGSGQVNTIAEVELGTTNVIDVHVEINIVTELSAVTVTALT